MGIVSAAFGVAESFSVEIRRGGRLPRKRLRAERAAQFHGTSPSLPPRPTQGEAGCLEVLFTQGAGVRRSVPILALLR